MTAQKLFRLHRQEVAIEHGGWLHERLGERHGRQLDRKAARLQHAALDVLGARPKMRVARVDLAPGVDDADHRPAGPVVAVVAELTQPRAMTERAQVADAEPAMAAQILRSFPISSLILPAWRDEHSTWLAHRATAFFGSGAACGNQAVTCHPSRLSSAVGNLRPLATTAYRHMVKVGGRHPLRSTGSTRPAGYAEAEVPDREREKCVRIGQENDGHEELDRDARPIRPAIEQRIAQAGHIDEVQPEQGRAPDARPRFRKGSGWCENAQSSPDRRCTRGRPPDFREC